MVLMDITAMAKKIVVGLLSDEDGVPVNIEVFDGNTQDPMTIASQIRKLAESFGVLEVTFIGDWAKKRTTYLKDHHRASPEIAEREVRKYAEKLRLNNRVEVRAEWCRILVIRNEAKLKDISRLDRCYALKSDVPSEMATAEQLHSRYKDLSKVERAFRTMKSAYLELRPWYVCTKVHTRAHAFIAMLLYRIEIELENGVILT